MAMKVIIEMKAITTEAKGITVVNAEDLPAETDTENGLESGMADVDVVGQETEENDREKDIIGVGDERIGTIVGRVNLVRDAPDEARAQHVVVMNL